VNCVVDEQSEAIAIRELWLHGVGFYQSPDSPCGRTITCHGPTVKLVANVAA